MNRYFKENGQLSPEGENLLVTFKSAIEMLFDTDECQDLTATELRMLNRNMLSMLNDRFSRRFAIKAQRETQLQELNDEEFKAYLDEKYGTIWELTGLEGLTEEEVRRLSPEARVELDRKHKGL